MPTVEKASDGRVNVRKAGQEFVPGERYDVDEDVATYLVEERGDFEYVDTDATDVEYTEVEDADGAEVCGAELSDGGTCDRPADECQYHGDDAED